MKKVLFAIIAAALLVSLSGCLRPIDTSDIRPSDKSGPLDETAEKEHRIIYQADFETIYGEIFYQLPKAADVGDIVEIRSYVVMDADYHVFASGKELNKSHADNNFWTWSFVMPDHDIEITVKPYMKGEVWGIYDEAQKIRVFPNIESDAMPCIILIKTLAELDKYYAENEKDLDLGHKDKVYDDTTIGFADAIERYDEAFFEMHDLIMIRLSEPSGSYRHEVLGFVPGESSVVVVSKIVPFVCTDDTADWFILVPIEKNTIKGEIEIKWQ